MAGVRAPEVVGTEAWGEMGCKSSGCGENRARGGMAGVRATEVVGTEAWGKWRV